MTVDELRKALAELDGGFEVKISGDAFVMGDGCTAYETHIAPGLSNVAVQGGFCVLWPDCSWDEAADYAERVGPGVEP